MMRILENDVLVQKFVEASNGRRSRSRWTFCRSQGREWFRWSSGQGPPIEIDSGTLCTAQVTVKVQRPISLVLPILRGQLASDRIQCA